MDKTYQEFVDKPLAVLANYDSTKRGQGLAGRWKLLASDLPEPFVPDPVVNQMDYSITPETLEHIRSQSEHDNYIIRTGYSSKLSAETREYLENSQFYILINPFQAQELLKDKSIFASWAEETDLPTIPSIDLADVLIHGEDVLEQLGDVDKYALTVSRRDAGKYRGSAEDIDGMRAYLEQTGNGAEILRQLD